MKSTLIKITPEGMDPEFMVVTTGSSAHEFVESYAKDNGYEIEERPCANRFACILQDLERIRTTIAVHCPIIMKQPALSTDCKPFNDELSQCFTNIEVACDEEDDEVEHEWLQPELPTYEEYTKDWSLADKLNFLHDEDISKPKAWTTLEIAHAVKDPEYFAFEVNSNLKQILQERQYIR